MKPKLGDIVLYTNLGDADGRFPPEQHPALVTKVVMKANPSNEDENAWSVSLRIFYEDGEFVMKDVPFAHGYERGHWTWRDEVFTKTRFVPNPRSTVKTDHPRACPVPPRLPNYAGERFEYQGVVYEGVGRDDGALYWWVV